MPVKKKGATKRSKNGRSRFIPILIGAFVATSLTFIAFYIWIDSTVAERLALRRSLAESAILTDYLSLPAYDKIDEGWIRNELRARNYVEVSRQPRESNEFAIQEGVLSLVTRPFTLPNGDKNPIRTLSRTLAAIDRNDPPAPPIVLEPRVLSYLGANQVRASTHRSFNEIPQSLKDAVVAVEDERFYSHFGIDLIGVSRALAINLYHRAFVQGGSTITQQLAKNLFFSPKKTLSRKILEALAALSIEMRLTKNEILEMYLNEVYLGQDGVVAVHGVGEAAQAFFEKPVDKLSIGESAMLAGLIRAPSAYNPWRHFARARERQHTVLSQMQSLGYLSNDVYARALSEPIKIATRSPEGMIAPHFIAAVRKELELEINLDSAIVAGARVVTGLSLFHQQCAEDAVERGLSELEKRYPSLKRPKEPLEAGLVSLDPRSGKIRAWIGGRSFTRNQFDHVNQARRQIGSTIKPFLYLTALDRNLNPYRAANPTSIIPDEPVSIELPSQDSWDPKNFDKEFRGDVTVRYALENSLNLPAVYISQRVGIPAFVEVLRRFHVSTSIPAVPSLALGSLETSLLELTAAYGALANSGRYVAPRLHSIILDGHEDIIESQRLQETEVADENAVYVLTDILAGVVNRGTGHSVRDRGYSGVAAGKTGTSNEARDGWFVGYTPSLSTGVWIGFDDNKKIGITGGIAAAPIWADYMKCVTAKDPAPDFIRPPGVVVVSIDSSTGLRATDECPAEDIIQEVFVRGTEPSRACSEHGGTPSYDERRPDFDNGFDESPPPRRREKSFWKLLFGDR